jgi:hypothetical protein
MERMFTNPEEQSQIKETLRAYYPKIISDYRNVLSVSEQKQMFQINENVYIDLLKTRGILDGKNYKTTDMNIDLRTATFGDAQLSGTKQATSLIRY